MTIANAVKVNNEREFSAFLNNNDILKEDLRSNTKQTNINILNHLGNSLSPKPSAYSINSGRLFESVVGMLFFQKNNVVSFPGKHKIEGYKDFNPSKGKVEDLNYDIVTNDGKVIQTKLTYLKADEKKIFPSSANKLKSLRPIIENGYIVEEKNNYDYYFVVFKNNEIHCYKTKLKKYLSLVKKTISTINKEGNIVEENGKIVAKILDSSISSNKRIAIISDNCDFFEHFLMFSNQQVLDAIKKCLELKQYKTKNMKKIEKNFKDTKKNTTTLEAEKSLNNFEIIDFCLKSLGGRLSDTGVNDFIRHFGFEAAKGGYHITKDFYYKVYNLMRQNETVKREEIVKIMKDFLVRTAMAKLLGKTNFGANVLNSEALKIGNILKNTKIKKENMSEEEKKYLEFIYKKYINASIIAIAEHMI